MLLRTQTRLIPPLWIAHGLTLEFLRVVPNELREGVGTALCLEVHDLVASKLVAGREKDLDFILGLLRHGFANPQRHP